MYLDLILSLEIGVTAQKHHHSYFPWLGQGHELKRSDLHSIYHSPSESMIQSLFYLNGGGYKPVQSLKGTGP